VVVAAVAVAAGVERADRTCNHARRPRLAFLALSMKASEIG
jgi:hypothetical protein